MKIEELLDLTAHAYFKHPTPTPTPAPTHPPHPHPTPRPPPPPPHPPPTPTPLQSYVRHCKSIPDNDVTLS